MDMPANEVVAACASAAQNKEGALTMDTPTADGWHSICALDAIPQLGARVVKTPDGPVAVFRNAEDEVFALLDRCPHKGGPLSQGIVFGRKVACPLHGWNIGLDDGNAVAPDVGCARSYTVRVTDGVVWLKLDFPAAAGTP